MSPARPGRATCVVGLWLIQDEGDLQVDPIGCDLVVLHDHLLALDPGAFDAVQALAGGLDALADGVLEAFFGFGADLDDFGDRHDAFSSGDGLLLNGPGPDAASAPRVTTIAAGGVCHRRAANGALAG